MSLAACLLAAAFLVGQDADDTDATTAGWPQWRGPLATGASPHADPPVRWSETENVRWKVALPGLGLSTPVVWGDQVFVTTAVPFGKPLEPRTSGVPGAHDNLPVTQSHRFEVLALRRSDGEVLWRRPVHEALPHEGGHVSASQASASPVTDGERVIAFFGSHGLYALSAEGELLWKVDLGDMRSKHGHGEGASPVLHEGTLVVNWDHEGPSFVVALDVATGEERWRVARDEVTSWATPIVVEHAGRAQVIVSGTTALRAYDLETGAVVWHCTGLSRNVVASPVAADGMVVAGSSYEKQAMLGISLDGAHGDLGRSENLVWVRRRAAPYVPSPLLYEGSVYFLHHYQPLLTQVSAPTGEEPHRPVRLEGLGNVYASPVAAAGRLYVTDLEGATLVLEHGAPPKRIALNRLDEGASASLALVGRELLLRGERHLYLIADVAQSE